MFLIDDILFSPLKGVTWLGKKLNDVIDKEMSDEGKIKERLMDLQFRFEMDEITQEQYTKMEGELLARLDVIRKAKEN